MVNVQCLRYLHTLHLTIWYTRVARRTRNEWVLTFGAERQAVSPVENPTPGTRAQFWRENGPFSLNSGRDNISKKFYRLHIVCSCSPKHDY